VSGLPTGTVTLTTGTPTTAAIDAIIVVVSPSHHHHHHLSVLKLDVIFRRAGLL
jgi:hypothetical protein